MRIVVGVLFLSLPLLVDADENVKQNSSPNQTVVAQVNQIPITWGEIRRELDSALAGRKTSQKVYQQLAEKMLETYIDRLAVQHHLQKGKHTVSQKSVDFAQHRLKKQLAVRKESLEDYLKRTAQTLQQFRRKLMWQLVWQAYLDSKITDKTVQAYFKTHHRDYDGTQLQVSQILWKVDANRSLQTVLLEAANVRKQIFADKITFAQAAQKYSSAVSKEKGGDLGYIRRHGQNLEAFSKAAFALKLNEISPPVVTTFGVHLIHCTKIQAGRKAWQEVKRQLKTDMATDLFQKLSKPARAKVTVKYLKKVPLIEQTAKPAK